MTETGKAVRLRVQSSIDALPTRALEALNAMLADATNGMSYEAMAAKVEALCGVRLSTSAICRYARRNAARTGNPGEMLAPDMNTAASRDFVRRGSGVDALPGEALEALNAMLADATNGMSYEAMAAKVEALCGVRLSASAIGRYAKRFIGSGRPPENQGMDLKKSVRLRVHSSIDALPAEALEALNDMLADATNGMSYKGMAAEVEALCGVRLSTSAIGRYAKRYMREVKQMDAVLERVRAVAEYGREHSAADLSAYINAMIQEGLMRRILDGADDIADMDIRDAMKYALQAQRTGTYVGRYRDECVERVEVAEARDSAAHMEWLRQALRSNPGLLAELAGELTKEPASST